MIYPIKLLLPSLPIADEFWHVLGYQDNRKGLVELDELDRASILVYELSKKKLAGD